MKILLGVPGGVAAFKALEFARLAVKDGHAVRVVQTPASLRFVGRASFAAITGAPVLASEFEDDPARGSWPGEPTGTRTPISHLALVESADVMVVAPATANTLARLAQGAAEDIVTTSALAARCPVIVAPAMNDLMWSNEATRDNVERLRARGLTVLEPGEGELASHGEEGKGRLPEPSEILAALTARHDAGPGPLTGRRVVVTAGGTREPLDDVRFIGNRSSGRMGVAIAEQAARLGADVTLIGANMDVAPPPSARYLAAGRAADMDSAVRSELPGADILVMAAAVADFTPVQAAPGKIDKSEGVPEIALQAAPDVLRGIAEIRRPGQVVVGFAAEHGARLDRAERKLEEKGLDMIVFNDISEPGIGFDSDENAVIMITAEGREPLARAHKSEIAAQLMQRIAALLGPESDD